MNKKIKLAAIAIAAAATAGISSQAMAEVKVYGKAHVSLGSLSNVSGAPYANGDGMYLSDHSSRFGVKGSFDIDGGMQAIFQHETTVDYAQDAGSYADERNTFAGLKGGFGSIKLGNHDMPFKMQAGKTDMWGDTFADQNAVIKSDTRQAGVVLYEGKFGGVGLALAYAPKGNANANTGASVNFKAGPVDLGIAYEGNSGAANATTGVRAGWDFGAGEVNLLVAQNGGATTSNEYVVSGKFKMGKSMALKAQYGKDEGANDELTAVGISNKFGDKTEGYLLYATGDLKGSFNPKATAVAIGLVQKF